MSLQTLSQNYSRRVVNFLEGSILNDILNSKFFIYLLCSNKIIKGDFFFLTTSFQENQTVQFPPSLRALKNANPRLKHFNVDTLLSVSIGRRIFCPATWNDQNVTLCIAFDLAMPMPQKDFYLTPIIEFVDKVPKEIIEKVQPSRNEDIEGK